MDGQLSRGEMVGELGRVELFTYQLLVGEGDRVVSVVLFRAERLGEGRLFIHEVQPNSLQRLTMSEG